MTIVSRPILASTSYQMALSRYQILWTPPKILKTARLLGINLWKTAIGGHAGTSMDARVCFPKGYNIYIIN